MMPKVNLIPIATIRAIVPTGPRNRAHELRERTLPVFEGQTRREIAAFATAIRRSFELHRKHERARPAPARYTGKPIKRRPLVPVSTLHRHSKRCLSQVLVKGHTVLARPGWWWCSKIGYPGLPLHEHRTKRGRMFLVAHNNDSRYVCPFDVPEQVA